MKFETKFPSLKGKEHIVDGIVGAYTFDLCNTDFDDSKQLERIKKQGKFKYYTPDDIEENCIDKQKVRNLLERMMRLRGYSKGKFYRDIKKELEL